MFDLKGIEHSNWSNKCHGKTFDCDVKIFHLNQIKLNSCLFLLKW